MPTQTNFSWDEFNKSLAGEREAQQQARAARDARDTQTTQGIVNAAAGQANDRAEREAARQSGTYEQIYGTSAGQEPTADPYGDLTRQVTGGPSSTSQALAGNPTRPGAEGYVDPSTRPASVGVSGKGADDPYGTYTTDISGLEPVQYAQNELDRRNRLQQIQQGVSGWWETGTLNPSQRQAGEAASPWDSLKDKLGVVAENAEQHRADLQGKLSNIRQQQETTTFNDAERAKLENDYSRVNVANQLWNEFNQLIEKYASQARAQAEAGRETTVAPYTRAMQDFVAKYGAEPPNMNDLANSSVVNTVRNQDIEAAKQKILEDRRTDAQRQLQGVLTNPDYGLQRNDGWQYGSGTDTGGIWSL